MQPMRWKVLDEAEVDQIHEQTLRILEETGVKVTHAEALAVLRRRGARVDEQAERVCFPRQLVRELLEQAPPVAIYEDMEGRRLEVGGDNRYYASLVTDPWVTDYRDGRRPPKLEDIRRHTIIGESLDRISALMRMQYPVSDIPEPDSCLKTMEVFLCHLTKHVSIYPTSVENCREWCEVYERIADALGLDLSRHPLLSVAMAVTSPLQIHGLNVAIMKMAIERNFPIISTVCPMAGTTAPCTVAGTALLSNVEALAPVLIAQAYKPGQPVLYGFGPSSTDMRSGHDLYYKAEKVFFKTIACQMGKFYRLPVSGEAGGAMTWRPDVQNGAEGMAYLLASHLGGQNLMGGVGSMDNANGMSAEQILMQCGLIDMAEYLARGVDMSDHKLALDAIHRAGPGGNYLVDDLTLELMRSDEFFHGGCFDFSGGYEPGALSMVERAHEQAGNLVSDYRSRVPGPVQEAVKGYFYEKYQDKSVAGL